MTTVKHQNGSTTHFGVLAQDCVMGERRSTPFYLRLIHPPSRVPVYTNSGNFLGWLY